MKNCFKEWSPMYRPYVNSMNPPQYSTGQVGDFSKKRR